MSERSFSVRLLANVATYVAKMREASQATSGFSKEAERDFERVGSTMQSVGGKMTTRLTVPLLAAGVGATKLSSDFSTAFAQMVGLADIPASEVDGLKDSILDLAGETAQAPQDLAEALYFAASAGLTQAQAMDAVTVAAQAAQVGLGATQDIVGLAASAIASYGAENITAAEATDILVSTIREGRAEPEELASTLGRVLPIASQLGVEFDEVGGTVAVLSNVFGDTNRTVTATQGLFVKLLSPTEQGKKALAEMGTSVEELHSAIDQDGLLGALDLLRSKGFDGNAEALRALFDDMEGFQAASALLGTDQAILAETFGNTANSVGALEAALESVDGDTNAVKQAWVDIQVALIQAGEIILPLLADVAGGVSALVSAFSDLPGPAQAVVLGFLAAVAAVGPLLSVVGTLVTNLAMLKTAFVVLRGAMMSHPLLALATVAAAVGSAVYLMGQRSDDAAGQVKELAASMKAASTSGEGLANYLNGIVEQNDPLLAALVETGITVDQLAAAALEGGPAYQDMKDRLIAVAEASGITVDGLQYFDGALDDLDETVAQEIRRQGDLADTLADTTSATEASTEATEDNAAKTRVTTDRVVNYKAAADRAAAASDALAEEQRELTAATEEAARVQQEYIESILAGVSAVFEYEQATMALDQAVDDYAAQERETTEVLNDSEASTEEKAKAMRDLREAEIQTAAAALETAVAYAREMGAADGSSASAQMQIDKLGELARKYPHLRDEIDMYVGELLRVPGTVNTTVAVSTGAAFRGMDEIERRLYRLSQRSVYIPVRVGSVGGSSAYMAEGGLVTRATSAIIGEAGEEAVMPLTRPARMRELLTDPRISGPISAAMGDLTAAPVMAGGGGGAVNVHRSYSVNVTTPLLANRGAVGQEVVGAIKAFERDAGTGWRD